MNKLPKWINNWFNKTYKNKEKRAEDILETLEILWSALDHFSKDEACIMHKAHAEEYRKRIAALGKD